MICKLQSKGYTQKTTQVYFGVQLQLTRSLTVYRQNEVERYHAYLVILITVVYTNNLDKPALMLFSIFPSSVRRLLGKRLSVMTPEHLL